MAKVKRPLCLAAVLYLVILAVLTFTGAATPMRGYHRLKEMLDRQETAVRGRIKRTVGAPGEQTYYMDHISLLRAPDGTQPTPATAKQENANQNVTKAGETEQGSPVLIPGDLCMAVQVRDPEERAQQEMVRYMTGDWVRVQGQVSFPASPTNPGQFDDETYCAARGILFRIYDGQMEMERPGRGVGRFLQRIRDALAGSYRDSMGTDEAAILTGITLGDTSEISSETKRLFREGGMAHMLAISALHVNMVAMWVYRFLRKRGIRIGICALAACLVLGAYMEMTGMSMSAIRAFVMFVIWSIAQVSGRRTDVPTSLAVAGIILTCRHPALLMDSGFYLSFGCVLSMYLLAEPVTRLLAQLLAFPGGVGPGRKGKAHAVGAKGAGGGWAERMQRRKRLEGSFAVKSLGASLAVMLGTMPICCWFYFQITPWACLVNLVVLPCMSFLFAFGALGGIIGLLFVGPGRFMLSVCHYLLHAFMLLCQAERWLPGGVVITGRPAIWQVLLYYILLGGILLAMRRRGNPLRPLLLAGAAIFLLLARIPPALQISFLDVGQGDSILLQVKGRSFLVDCGSSSVENVWSKRVSPALRYYGISRLDGIFISHGDSDHISGFLEWLEHYESNSVGANRGDVSVDCVFVSLAARAGESARNEGDVCADQAAYRIRELAREKGISLGVIEPGQRISGGGGWTLTCLYPDEADVRAVDGDLNMASMVLRLDAGRLRLFLTGDLEKEGEERLVRKLAEEETSSDASRETYTLLKVGHHGSRNATSDALLDILRPQAAVISCGRRNRYGHPAERVLDSLSRAGVEIYRTDRDGCIVIRKVRGSLRAFSYGSE